MKERTAHIIGICIGLFACGMILYCVGYVAWKALHLHSRNTTKQYMESTYIIVGGYQPGDDTANGVIMYDQSGNNNKPIFQRAQGNSISVHQNGGHSLIIVNGDTIQNK